MSIIFQFLNENIGVVTVVVGSLALYLYIKARVDKRRDAASLILQEIRYAEQQIRNSGSGMSRRYSLSSKLLPTNSWNDNIHLFIKDLKETEIDAISAFYSQATFIDFLIGQRSTQKINQEFQVRTLPTSQATGQDSPQELTQQQIAQFVSVPNPNEQITINLLNEISNNIEYLYNTPAVDKLRKISERKWYRLV